MLFLPSGATFSTSSTRKSSSFSMKRTATIISGLYLVGKYVKDRLEETKEGIMQERVARDTLKRRYYTNQQNISYTVLALISTLSEQITEGMDVETVTAELQSLSSKKGGLAGSNAPGVGVHQEVAHAPPRAPLPSNPDPGATSILPPPPPQSTTTPTTSSDALSLSLPSAAPTSDPEASSDVSSTSHSMISTSSSSQADEVNLSQSSTSWMTDNVSVLSPASLSAASMELVDRTSESESSHQQQQQPVTLNTANGLADSFLSTATTNTTSSSMLSYPESIAARPGPPPAAQPMLPAPGSGRTKAELWNEIKIMTFTRTLTTLYSTTLLSLFTSLQLTLLSRSSYVQYVVRQARDEIQEEKVMSMLSGGGFVGLALATLPIPGVQWFVGGGLNGNGNNGGRGEGSLEEQLFSLLQQPEGHSPPWEGGEDDERDDEIGGNGRGRGISEEVERKYLTLSWWMLHVGWKDVGERVRKGVEDVLDGVSLKTKLGIVDLHRLISDIRRRVEHEVTFEGRERRIDFLSTLLPPTPEMTQRVLSEGGFFPSSSPLNNPHFPPLPGSTLSQSGVESPPEPSVTSFESQRLEEEGHPQNAPPAPPVIPSNLSPEDEEFTSLLDETRQTIASPDFAKVLEVCMERAVEVLFDDLEKDVYFPHSQMSVPAGGETGSAGGASGGEEVRIRLAALLPGLTRWSKEVLNGLPNVLVDTLMSTREVLALSAIVYSRFEDQFIQ